MFSFLKKLPISFQASVCVTSSPRTCERSGFSAPQQHVAWSLFSILAIPNLMFTFLREQPTSVLGVRRVRIKTVAFPGFGDRCSCLFQF